MKFALILFSLCVVANARTSFMDSVKRLKWGDLEVVWVEDDKFPNFTASLYYQDGALSDSIPGLTQATLDQLSSGTSKEGQKQIAEFFEFYGANVRDTVTHEYSIVTLQGLTKDIRPLMGKVCELMNDATYPASELTSYINRSKSNLNNLVTSHSTLADRVFRQLSLNGTPYSSPVEGNLKSLGELKPQLLKERLKQLNSVKKVLYLAGPSDVLSMKEIIQKDCNWTNISTQKSLSLNKPESQSAIYLLPVKGANQAQIRIGRYVTLEEVAGKHDLFNFLAGYMGGGFTSKLVQELRVKRGLTYSASAYVSMQRDYGRAGIMTFSKNETAAEAISIVRDSFSEMSDAGKINPNEFKHQQGHQIGGFAFGFEETSAFLGRIMLYDHQGRKLQELADFPDRMARLTPNELAAADMEVFPWDKLSIVVVGDLSLEKSLSRIRPVRVLKLEDYL